MLLPKVNTPSNTVAGPEYLVKSQKIKVSRQRKDDKPPQFGFKLERYQPGRLRLVQRRPSHPRAGSTTRTRARACRTCLHAKGEAPNVGCRLTWGRVRLPAKVLRGDPTPAQRAVTILKYDVEVRALGSQRLTRVLAQPPRSDFPRFGKEPRSGRPDGRRAHALAKERGARSPATHSRTAFGVNPPNANKRFRAASTPPPTARSPSDEGEAGAAAAGTVRDHRREQRRQDHGRRVDEEHACVLQATAEPQRSSR